MNSPDHQSPLLESTFSEILFSGIVQGVGFRPYLVRTAKKLKISGFCHNTSAGLSVFIKASAPLVQEFISEIAKNAPSQAHIQKVSLKSFDIKDSFPQNIVEGEFKIFEGQNSAKNQRVDKSPNNMTPFEFSAALFDSAPCAECLAEFYDPANRRFQYPFISCCECGPRYSILKNAPFERANTSMADFPMCENCAVEYQDSGNRRFHAVTQSCPNCGPRLSHSLDEIVQVLNRDGIVAIKGVGGFQFLCLAESSTALKKLREIKHRPVQPFAVLVLDLETCESLANLNQLERNLLQSSKRPIVLCESKNSGALSPLVSSGFSTVGLMLPNSGLYQLLLSKIKKALVCTSANISGEVMCHLNAEAEASFLTSVDLLVTHNRDIFSAMDDSVVRVINDQEMLIRPARGYYPMTLNLAQEDFLVTDDLPALSSTLSHPVIVGVGAQLKNTLSFLSNNTLYTSLGHGDLSREKSLGSFDQACAKFSAIKNITWAHDLNPALVSSQRVEHFVSSSPTNHSEPVQHHVAHIFSNLAEKNVSLPVVGIVLDGFGYGESDGNHENEDEDSSNSRAWGGEIFTVNKDLAITRVASLKSFPLIGGEKSFRQPRLSALGMLFETFGLSIFSDDFIFSQWLKNNFSHLEIGIYKNILHSHSVRQSVLPKTSSCGRLFDGVASLLSLSSQNTFEGEAAMRLESAAINDTPSPINSLDLNSPELDWRPWIRELLTNFNNSTPSQWALSFHQMLAALLCETLAKINPLNHTVILSGGCFQNKILSEQCVKALNDRAIPVSTHSRVPPNDAGLSLGQVYYVTQKLLHNKTTSGEIF